MTDKVTEQKETEKNEVKGFKEKIKAGWEKVLYALEKPIRVKEEYDRLVAEIKELEKMK